MPSRPASPSRFARTLYAFFIASTLIVSVGAFVTVRGTAALRSELAAIDYVAALVGLGAVLLLDWLRRRTPERRADQSPDDWWRLSMGQAVLLWGLLDLVAMLGAIELFLTGHVIGFGILAAVALGGLLTLSPGRLAQE